MSVNKYRPHLLVLAEDEPNVKIVNAFLLHHSVKENLVQVLPPVRGWTNVADEFKKVYADKMQELAERRFLLVIDFDSDDIDRRLSFIRKDVPEGILERVFVLGVKTEPEDLKTVLGHMGLEDIGELLSQECADERWSLWEHELLKHNKAEVERMVKEVRPFLFD